jgi:lariat debranching enzyme
MEKRLGNPMLDAILIKLKPQFWFSSHLHVKHTAEVYHNDGSSTRFIALDKVLNRREFLEIIEFDSKVDTTKSIEYDLEWLAILRISCIRSDLLFTKKQESIDEFNK